MKKEIRARLQGFDIEQLRQELLARGASGHGLISAALAFEKIDLGGASALAPFASEHIVAMLREKQKAIYGTDDRKDLYDVNLGPVLQNSESVCSLFRASRVKDNGDGTSTLVLGRFGTSNNLCPDEPFVNQPVGAFCSGFLVAPDLIATAGHCVNQDNVTTIRFVFGYRMTDPGAAPTNIPNSNIYAGAAVVGRVLTKNAADWCVVRLSRPVAGRAPLQMRRAGRIADGQSIYVIGHPCGLPAKFADGANVRTNTQPSFFTANLDTYGGNSGSPVFNADTHQVEAVLVRGAPDFVPKGVCMVSAVCSTNGCDGEDCTRVTEFAAIVP